MISPLSTYYLRATSDALCRAIVDSITRNARVARERAETRSRLRRIQASILWAYESTLFQSFVALLIVAVYNTTRRKHRGRVGVGWFAARVGRTVKFGRADGNLNLTYE